MKILNLLSLLLLLVLYSCGTPKVIQQSQIDSVRTIICEQTIYRDSIVYLPIPSEKEKVILLDTDTSRLSTSLAFSEAYVSEGKLHHSLANRVEALVPINVKLPDRVSSIEHTHQLVRTVTIEVERELTRWQKFIQALGLGSFIAAIGVALYFTIRILRKLF